MSSHSERKNALRALAGMVSLDALPRVQPMLLLQVLIGLPQAVNEGAAQSEAVARTLILDGQQRLRKLRRAAPHLDLSLARLLDGIRSDPSADERLSEEESAVQAVLEMCLGLMLRWLSRVDDQSRRHAESVILKPLPLSEIPFLPLSSPRESLSRARSCLIS